MEAGRLHDQVNMFTAIVTGKEGQSPAVVRAFIESSDSRVARLIVNYGTWLQMHLSCYVSWSEEKL